jgi:hypothetical protein
MGSTSVETLGERLKEAVDQVEREIRNGVIKEGFVAVNVDALYKGIALPQDPAERTANSSA